MKKLILLLGLAITLISCNEGRQRTDIECDPELKGGIIYSKFSLNPEDTGDDYSDVFYDVKIKGEIVLVKVYPIQGNYKVGDTIKGNCLNK